MIKKILNSIIFFMISFLSILQSSVRRIRKVKFDSYPENYKFYNKKYYFILFGKDKYVSRNTFVNGPHDFQLLKKAIKILNRKIYFLIDVGANIGTFCIPAVKDKIIKKCIAIEPVYKINKILNTNILLNDLNQEIQVFDNIISNKKSQKLSLLTNKNNYGDNKFFISKKLNKKSNSIQLDSFINFFDTKKLIIKIDVQGFEDRVLIGAKKFIKSKVPLLIEFNQNFIRSNYFNKIVLLLKKNYKYVCILDDQKNLKVEIKNLNKEFFKDYSKKSDLNCFIF